VPHRVGATLLHDGRFEAVNGPPHRIARQPQTLPSHPADGAAG
jgi:hypothetical protein